MNMKADNANVNKLEIKSSRAEPKIPIFADTFRSEIINVSNRTLQVAWKNAIISSSFHKAFAINSIEIILINIENNLFPNSILMYFIVSTLYVLFDIASSN